MSATQLVATSTYAYNLNGLLTSLSHDKSTTNLYRYVGNAPTTATDPTGTTIAEADTGTTATVLGNLSESRSERGRTMVMAAAVWQMRAFQVQKL